MLIDGDFLKILVKLFVWNCLIFLVVMFKLVVVFIIVICFIDLVFLFWFFRDCVNIIGLDSVYIVLVKINFFKDVFIW